jgi:hypothetical protein
MTAPKAFHFANAQIGSISTRVDGGIGFRISTGEIPVENLATFLAPFLSLKQKNVEVTIKPLDMEDGDEPVEIKSEAEQKTPSTRLRSILFVHWKQLGSPGEFSTYYTAAMEKFIEHVRSKLDKD